MCLVNITLYDFPVSEKKRTVMKLLKVSSLSGFYQNNIWNMCEKNDGWLARQLAYRMMTWGNLKQNRQKFCFKDQRIHNFKQISIAVGCGKTIHETSSLFLN